MSAILFESDELLAIDKPPGISSLPYEENEIDQTAAGIALHACPGLNALGMEQDFGAVHRLDQGTSGVLLFAKTPSLWASLRAAWKTDQVQKTYRALTPRLPSGAPSCPLIVTTAIGHDEKSAKKMRAILEEKDLKRIRGTPQEARTDVLAVSTGILDSLPILDWTVRIKTGVRHQIRVHLASLGAPILGDTQYRGLASTRLWLHSRELKITVPGLLNVAIQSPLPEAWPKSQ